MSESRPQVKNKLTEWYNWIVSHIPEPIKDTASRTFKAAKNKIMGLYKSFKGKESEEAEEPVVSAGHQAVEQN